MQIDWLKEPWTPDSTADSATAAAGTEAGSDSNEIAMPTIIAAGKATMIADRRYRVYRPHNSALSVLIIRRTRKHDSGVYRCNLSGSSTRQKYLVLNVTGLLSLSLSLNLSIFLFPSLISLCLTIISVHVLPHPLGPYYGIAPSVRLLIMSSTSDL